MTNIEGIVRFDSWDENYYVETLEYNCGFGMILPDVGKRVRITVEEIDENEKVID